MPPAPDTLGQAALDRAFEHENLLLVYQPIHDARTREIVAAEALMRQRRESGEIREAHIISEAAEDASHQQLVALDAWMLRLAVRDAAEWPIALNVNLSPREFQEGNVIDRLGDLFTPRLNLEITETAYICDPKDMRPILRELKEIGTGLWLDDFGSGHSTLEHLLHFPVDGIKIAATFVKGIPDDERSCAITRSMIALAHDLGMKANAEGVEHDEQLEFLLANGCDFVQGFLFSRPMPRVELDALLHR